MTPEKRPDLGAWGLARAQHWVITRRQLLDAGFTEEAIRHRVRQGRLWRLYRGVYAVGRWEVSREGGWLAAVLACGPGAALSHLSAGALWEVVEWAPARPTVSVPTSAGRRGPRGIDLIRAAKLRPEEVITREAIPVTTLVRTLIDLASILAVKPLRSAVRQAERLHDVDLAQLRIHLDDHPLTSARHARLRHLLDALLPGSGRTESALELAFLELCAKHRLPAPEVQVPVGRHRADFLWRAECLVVEVDGRGSHDGYVAFTDDRVKDRALKRAGYEVLRFTWAEVIHRPAMVAREVREALQRRRSELASTFRGRDP